MNTQRNFHTWLAALFAGCMVQLLPVLASPGDLDMSFGIRGKVITPIGSGDDDDYGRSVLVQRDGKILVAGSSDDGNGYVNTGYKYFALTRYNPDGTLDAAFGNWGKVTSGVGGIGFAGASSMALQGDGKIVVAGESLEWGGMYAIALARYSSNGTLDTRFGNQGRVITSINAGDEWARGVAVQSNGKIVVAGSSRSSGNTDYALVRYNSNGSLDTSFGNGGKVVTPVGSWADYGESVILQNDGKIVVAGSSTIPGNPDLSFCALVRYHANGSLDAGFGSGGKVITSIGRGKDCGQGAACQSDGKILVAGDFYNGSDNDFALVRYNANGTLDTGFGTGGKVITPVGSGYDSGGSVAVQVDGKIIVAGDSNNGNDNDFALVRYNANGTLDTGFGSGGKVTTPVGDYGDSSESVAVQIDGKIIVAGSSYDGISNDFAVARYDGGPLLLPEIAVEKAAGSSLSDGKSAIGFGSVKIGSSSSSQTFVVRNLGTSILSGLAVTEDGANASDFRVGRLGVTNLAAGASTTFTIVFAPGASGPRKAVIHISSNDLDENSFDISLAGSGIAAPTPPTIATKNMLGGGVIKVDYRKTLVATGGKTPYQWSITAGSLPPGLSLSRAGVISGTPKSATTANFTVRVTGGDGLHSKKDFGLTIAAKKTKCTLEVGVLGRGSVSIRPKMAAYPKGTRVTLTARPGKDHRLARWGGDASGKSISVTITMSGDRKVIARFVKKHCVLSLDVGTGGEITASPKPDSNGRYPYGAMVYLTANPVSGYSFKSWKGDASGSKRRIRVVMDRNKDITAEFEADGIQNNRSPVARLSYSTHSWTSSVTGIKWTTVFLNASDSYDPDGGILHYYWSIHDDGFYEELEKNTSIVIVSPRTVSLRVEDNLGATNETSITIDP